MPTSLVGNAANVLPLAKRPRLTAAVRATAVLVASAAVAACLPEQERTTLAPVESSAEELATDGVRGVRVGSRHQPVVTWTGHTLAGDEVTISADAAPPGVTFVGELPSVIAQLDRLAHAEDCESLGDQLAFWRLRMHDDPANAEIASAFARRASDVALFIGCPGVESPSDG